MNGGNMGFVAVVVTLSAAASPQFTWSVTSSNGAARLSQSALENNVCSLECELSGKQVWNSQGCLSGATDFNFVANDCSAAITLFEYPLKIGTAETTPVAAAATASGRRVFRLQEVGAPSRGEGKRMRWLGGVVGEPGVKPRVNSTETGVEFTTLDGRVRSVRFTSPDDFLPVRAAGPAAVAANGGMYQFTNEEGATQFVMGLNEVPKRFRKGARPVASEIGVVHETRRAAPPPTPSWERTEPRRPVSVPSFVVEKQPATPPQPQAGNSCGVVGMTEGVCNALNGRKGGGGGIVSLPPAAPPSAPVSPYR